MGKLQLINGSWSGKVGQLVGAKWKDKHTLRSYAKPANPNTPAQQTTRTGFKEITSFTALFSDQLKSISSLDTKSMSVRNAIIKLNHAQVAAGALVKATLAISRGGLPEITAFTPSAPAGLTTLTATWSPAVGATISEKAKVVVVAVDAVNKRSYVGSALNSVASITLTGSIMAGAAIDIYSYLLDYRGSSKIGSISSYEEITAPAS